MQGVVKWFDAKKGFGFLLSDEVTDEEGKTQDVFVHWTKIQMEGFKKLEQGESVTFELVRTPEGKPQAESVVRTDVPASPEA